LHCHVYFDCFMLLSRRKQSLIFKWLHSGSLVSLFHIFTSAFDSKLFFFIVKAFPLLSFFYSLRFTTSVTIDYFLWCHSWNCSNYFLATLVAIKCSSVTRIKCLIAMYKVSKNENFGSFGSLIEHGSHWINFIIFIFISENNRYFTYLYKLWSKFNTCHRFCEEKGEFGGLMNESLWFKWGALTMLGQELK